MHTVSLQPNSMLADVLKESNTNNNSSRTSAAMQNTLSIFDRKQKEN